MIPPLAAPVLATFLMQLGVLLGAALCLGLLARRLGLPALAGEMLAGVLLGPSVLGHLGPGASDWLFPKNTEQAHLLDATSQAGVLLLVSLTAAHLDTTMLRTRAGDVARIGLGALLIPLGAGIALGYLIPAALLPPGAERGVVALFVGVALCITAIPVIAKTLADLGMLHRDIGQLTLASAALDDTVGWLLLAVVAAMATIGTGATSVGLALGYLVLVLLAAVLLGKPLARLGHWLSAHAAGAVPALAVVLTMLYSCATAGLGLEAVLGAFLAGVTVLRRLNPAHLAGLNTITLWVFAPIFVAGIGLRIDLAVLASPLVALAAVVAVLVAVLSKLLGAYLGARASRLSHWEGLALGAGMNSRGMVEVVIALAGLRLGLLSPAGFTIVVLIALVTSLLAPPMLRIAMRRVPSAPAEIDRHNRHRAWSSDQPRVSTSSGEPS
ncbi:cation:proton antiporter [Pseudonocardia spinosispora]|uniref:cation:proton antiporter n=1 Tax=Pseudonocardia spinosispora TaxID=103441 RepID=UPI001FDFC1F4|nr:cation:proton antiporter [Pseudonocardia spinosispora]